MSGPEGLASGWPAILALWSAPRSRSTAFARMMAERGDCTVLHEPFSHVLDFGSERIGDELVTTERQLIPALRRAAADGPLFFKDTTDFRYPVLLADTAFLRAAVHTFIIRHPAEAIASHYRLNPRLGRDEIGFAWLAEIYDAVAAATGRAPVVIDSDDLVERPADTVAAYCAAVGIPFLPGALAWPPGMTAAWRRTERWHESTSRTSGFVRGAPADRVAADPVANPMVANTVLADPVLAGYLDFHLPFYEKLRAVALRP
jgi:hypothetical protein